MSITYAQAFDASEFHISHAGLPCTVWHRAGWTHPGPDDGQFFLPVERDGDDGRQWHHITGVNAGDFHTLDGCPRARSDNPPVAGNSDQSEQPVLDNGYRDDRGRDALGFDAEGYDAEGYDADGYNRDGDNADGYNRDGDNADGYNRDAAASGLDLAELWQTFAFSGWNPAGKQSAFLDRLREMVPSDQDAIGDVRFCGSCDSPEWDGDMTSVQDGYQIICQSCWDEWSDCDCCEERYPGDDLSRTLSGSDVCDSCRDERYTYCEECDGYYYDGDAGDHYHNEGGCDCESAQPEFSIRNDGCEPLAQDTRITVTLPAGTISAEGLKAIRRYLQDEGYSELSYDLGKLGDAWQTRAGNYAKRLSRHAWQAHQAKLPPEVMSQVGCIARDHSTAVSTDIDVTRDLNQDAGYFYHDTSCWWSSYSESRCALKTNGGFGLRSLGSDGDATGRAWVLPLKTSENGKLTPTFETMTPDAFVVFNGYGDLGGYTGARIAAHMAGWTYRKIGFECRPMYVNAGGYLVAPEDIAEKYTDGSLSLSVSQHARLYETERERELVNA